MAHKLCNKDICEMRDDDNVKIDPAIISSNILPEGYNKSGIFVSYRGHLFKQCVHVKFPGGKFSQIKKQDDVCLWGILWIEPTFEPDDLVDYFESFGADVTPSKLVISRAEE